MMTEMKLPACYAVIDENEMTYLDGGATIADSERLQGIPERGSGL